MLRFPDRPAVVFRRPPTYAGLAALTGRLGRFAVAMVLASMTTGCFYSSTWGARKASQRRNAAAAAPASLSAPAASDASEPSNVDGASPTRGADASSVLRVRVYATAPYAAQTPDWKSHVGAILSRAGTTLQATIGERLELEAADAWDHATAAHLDADLAALRDADSGDGVDLVIGFVGGLPLVTEDFEQVGLSEIHGKHLVVRAPDVARDYEAIEKAFDELSVEERRRLRRERTLHREVAVLLHEIGHALGAQHHPVAGSLMQPRYDPKMSEFDADAVAEMRKGLAQTASAKQGNAGAAGAPVAARSVTPSAPSASASAVTAPSAPAEATNQPPSDLADVDRDRWRRATELTKSGDSEGAWTVAKPLFARYPKSYAVQDLRCKLAMAREASYEAARAECDPLMKLTMAGAKP